MNPTKRGARELPLDVPGTETNSELLVFTQVRVSAVLAKS